MTTEREDMRALASEIREKGAAPLRSARSAADVAASAAFCAALTEEFLKANRNPLEASRIACGPGCGSCCVLYVSVLFPEAVAIALYLRRALDPAELTRVSSRLDDLCREIRGLDAGENPVMPRSCAFLDRTGSCTIYPVRPLLCRAVTSTDPEGCREAIAGSAFGETPEIVMNLFQKEVMETAYGELGRLIAAAGRDDRSFTLPLLVRRVLDDPGTVEHWIGGGKFSEG